MREIVTQHNHQSGSQTALGWLTAQLNDAVRDTDSSFLFAVLRLSALTSVPIVPRWLHPTQTHPHPEPGRRGSVSLGTHSLLSHFEGQRLLLLFL